jgi:hypothetical protein
MKGWPSRASKERSKTRGHSVGGTGSGGAKPTADRPGSEKNPHHESPPPDSFRFPTREPVPSKEVE